MKDIFKIISKFSPISEESFEEFSRILETKTLKKKDFIADFREIPSDFYILKSGIARSFIIDDKGKEHTRSLYLPMQTIGAFSALVTGKSTKTAYDCLTDCEMYVGNFERFKKLASVNIEISNLYCSLLELTFIRMESRIFELSVLDAKQRYLKLLKKVPQIEELIPQYHIASYLNVSAVQLSRIKKELQDS